MNSISKVPAQLARNVRPAVEAALTPEELARIFADVEFKALAPFAAPEPSIGAAVRLASGGIATLSYGKGSHLLRVDLPATESVGAFLREVTLPREAITWRRRERRQTAKKATAAKPAAKRATAKRSSAKPPSRTR